MNAIAVCWVNGLTIMTEDYTAEVSISVAQSNGSIEYTDCKNLVIPNTVKELSQLAVNYNQQLKTLVIGNEVNE